MEINTQFNNGELQLTHPHFDAAWDLQRGGILVFLRDRRNGVVLVDARAGGPCPDVVVAISATLEELQHDVHMSNMGECSIKEFFNPERSCVYLHFQVANDEISIERDLRISLDSAWIEERISLQNVSDRNLLIDRYPDWEAAGKTAVAGDLYHWGVNPGGVDYELNGLRIGGDYENTSYVHPAAGYPFFYNNGKFAEMGETEFSLVAGHHGVLFPCIMAWSEPLKAGLLLSVLHDRCLRYVHVAADQESKGGTLTAQVWWARWLAPRERQEVATWHLVPFVGDYGDMLAEYRQWLNDEQGIHGPKEASPRLDEMFVSHFPHPIVESLGDYEKIIPYLDGAAKVGITAVWWNQAWLDSIDLDRRAWMSRNQAVIEDGRYGLCPLFGGELGLEKVIAHIRATGLLNIVWMTGWGVSAIDPIWKEHPDMLLKLRRPCKRVIPDHVEGHAAWPEYDPSFGLPDPYVYSPFGGSTAAADSTHPVWREFWLHNQDYWVDKGVDGIFFDSFNPMPPNYRLYPWPGQISLEIMNLQREARRKALARQPEFFSFTEGGGYLMATVNDFTHAWHGATTPPLAPYRSKPLTPAEEARFHRDELLSMIVGGRAWANVAKEDEHCLPRVLFNMFVGKMPVLWMYGTSAHPHPITNEPEFWKYYKPLPADQPDPAEKAHWDVVSAMWKLRQTTPELKSGRLEFRSVSASDPGVFAFLRELDGNISLVVLNFHETPVSCEVRVDWMRAGFEPEGDLSPVDLFGDHEFSSSSADEIADGFPVPVAGRNGRIIKLK